MGHVMYDNTTDTVWADVRMVSASVEAGEGEAFCFGFDIFEPKGLLGIINIVSGDYNVTDFVI